MAKTQTTLSGAVAIDSSSITVASATGFTPGAMLVIDAEELQVQKTYASGTVIPVLRGLSGSATQAHPTGAFVTVQLATDYAGQAPQAVADAQITSPSRTKTSYTAAGALTLPLPGDDAVAVLNGTTILAMTLANPTTDMDGSFLHIVGNGKAAHTVTYTAGLGNVGGTADVITFAAAQSQGITLLACGGFWVGTGMNTAVAGAGATINGVGLG